MKHANTFLAMTTLALAFSASALAAGGGVRANGSFSHAATVHEQASMHMQSPVLQVTPAAAAGTQVNGRRQARTTASGHTTGQPDAECGSATAPNTPGNAASAPGSAFNPEGHAGTVYAGEQPQNSGNPASVSQYDAACLHQH